MKMQLSKSHPETPSDRSPYLWLSIAGPILAILIAIALSAYVLFADIAHSQDDAFATNSSQLVERSLKAKITELDKLADDNAEWDTGYEYSSIAWNQQGIAASYYSEFSEAVAVVSANGNIKYLSTSAQMDGLGATSGTHIANAAASNFLSKATRVHTSNLRQEPKASNNLVNHEGGLVILTTSVIRTTPASSLIVQPSDQRYFYALVTLITPARLEAMAELTGVGKLTYSAGEKRPTSTSPVVGLAVKDKSNATIGWLVWPHTMPGSAAFKSRALNIGIGLLALGLLSILVSAKLIEGQMRIHKNARRLAEDASRMKSQFLANMSHELRTPLNAVIGYAEIIAEDCEISGAAETAKDAGRISRAAHHLLSLINAVLDHAKLEAGKIEITPEVVDLCGLFEEVVEVVQKAAEDNGNTLVLNCDPEIGSAMMDRMRLKQSILNLVSNGLKFTQNGKVTINVRGVTLDGVEHIRFAVSDTGIGMNSEVLGRLFQPFEQANGSTTRTFGGTGLGLSITKQLVEAMAGSIEVSSEEGVGSIFTVLIPRGTAGLSEILTTDRARLQDAA